MQEQYKKTKVIKLIKQSAGANLSHYPNDLLLSSPQRPKLKAKKKGYNKDECQMTNRKVPKGRRKIKDKDGRLPELNESITANKNMYSKRPSEVDDDVTRDIPVASNYCLASMAYNDDGDELDKDGNIQ